MVKLLQSFEPRFYNTQTMIQDQYQEIYEVLLVDTGGILIGYRLFNSIIFAKEQSNRQIIIGDFSCIHNKVSEFLYSPSEHVQGYAIKKSLFMKLIEDPIGKKIQQTIKKRYIQVIRNPLIKHREIQALKFKSRSDYVDL